MHDWKKKLITLLLHSLFSFCNIQLFVTVLRVSWRRGKHHEWNSRKTHQIFVPLWNLLFSWKDLHHRFLEILQAGYTSILPCQACDGIHYHLSSIERTLSWWRLECKHWIHLHHNHLQCLGLARTLWTLFVLFCNKGFAYSIWSSAQVLHNKIGHFPQFLARWDR